MHKCTVLSKSDYDAIESHDSNTTFFCWRRLDASASKIVETDLVWDRFINRPEIANMIVPPTKFRPLAVLRDVGPATPKASAANASKMQSSPATPKTPSRTTRSTAIVQSASKSAPNNLASRIRIEPPPAPHSSMSNAKVTRKRTAQSGTPLRNAAKKRKLGVERRPNVLDRRDIGQNSRGIGDDHDNALSDEEDSDESEYDAFGLDDMDGDSKSGSSDQDSEESDQDEDDDDDDDEDDDDIVPTRVIIKRKQQPKQSIRRAMAATRATQRPSSRKLKLMPQVLPSRPIEQAKHMSETDVARERLHAGAVPDSLPCREGEFAEIYGHVAAVIEEGSGACIYVSGVPGTGKTATFYGVLRMLQAQVEQGDLPPFDFIEINGMKLTDPSHAYSVLWEGLTQAKVSPQHAETLLYTRFTTPSPSRRMCVVLMDELDLLVTKKQTVMYNFFNWPNLEHSRLIVVAIANTMDLPERMLSNKGIATFDPNAIEFCARKVSSVTGDARRALDICRRALEILEDDVRTGRIRKNATAVATSVNVQIIDAATDEMLQSPLVMAIRRCSVHQRIFLAAVLRQMRTTGLAEVDFAHSVMGDPIQKVRLNVSPQDIISAVRKENDKILVQVLEG
eukprot:jgi/Hompol1/1228/HPOL_002674-RA